MQHMIPIKKMIVTEIFNGSDSNKDELHYAKNGDLIKQVDIFFIFSKKEEILDSIETTIEYTRSTNYQSITSITNSINEFDIAINEVDIEEKNFNPKGLLEKKAETNYINNKLRYKTITTRDNKESKIIEMIYKYTPPEYLNVKNEYINISSPEDKKKVLDYVEKNCIYLGLPDKYMILKNIIVKTLNKKGEVIKSVKYGVDFEDVRFSYESNTNPDQTITVTETDNEYYGKTKIHKYILNQQKNIISQSFFTQYSHDKNGRIILPIGYSKEDEELDKYQRIDHNYDEFGNVIMSKTSYINDDYDISNFEYKYDDYENWIYKKQVEKRYKVNYNDRMTKFKENEIITTRNIEYF